MATIKYFLQSEKNPANIYMRLSVDRKTVLRRKSGYIINPDNWSKNGFPKPNDAELKRLKSDLQDLSTKIEKSLNLAVSSGVLIDGEWLQTQIDTIQGKQKKTDIDRLINYMQLYIENLPYKVSSGGKTGVVHNTIQKYTTLKKKISEFENYKGTQFYIKDIGLPFSQELTKYFLEVDKLSRNSTGRYIKYIKSVCNDAQRNGIEVNQQLNQVRGISEKSAKIYLTFEELEKIEKKKYSRSALENAKDWLIIGCYIGQRVSDLLSLTSNNINSRNGIELIELTQKKTGKRVSIPIHHKVKEILTKRNGEFPERISDQKFNLHIKDICELAKINQSVSGGKMAKDEKTEMCRKEFGSFPKHKLVTSHICRRSFATNFYGIMPTPLIISITGHSTEQQFLVYIGKDSNDYAIQIAEYFNLESLKAKKEPVLMVVKQAN